MTPAVPAEFKATDAATKRWRQGSSKQLFELFSAVVAFSSKLFELIRVVVVFVAVVLAGPKSNSNNNSISNSNSNSNNNGNTLGWVCNPWPEGQSPQEGKG